MSDARPVTVIDRSQLRSECLTPWTETSAAPLQSESAHELAEACSSATWPLVQGVPEASPPAAAPMTR
jgi:hypothetical protein